MGLPQVPTTPEMEDAQVTLPYPAATRQTAGEVNGVLTDVMVMSFSDKVMITITQQGRLAQWVCYASSLSNYSCSHLLPDHCSPS